MKLLLHIETKNDIDLLLQIVYAFIPSYLFKHVGDGVLETIIDASHMFTDEQWNIIENHPYTVQFVLPQAPTTNPTPQPAPTPVS